MTNPTLGESRLTTVKSGFFYLAPSPDGKWLAIRGLGDDVKDFDFLLVSKDGEVRNRPER